MTISYKRLWKLPIDKGMLKKDLHVAAGLSTNVIAKMETNQDVSTESLRKICKALKRKLRRKVCLLLSLLFCFTGVTGALAAEKMKMVSIPERGISIAVPESYITFERGDQTLDSRLGALGLSENEWRETMQTNGIYLYVFSPDLQKNINVVVNDNSGFESIGYMTDDFLSTFIDLLKEQFEDIGARVEKSDIKRYKDMAYIRCWLDGTQVTGQYSLQYLTLIDSQAIVITVSRNNQKITSEDEELLDQMIKSSQLTKNTKPTSVSKPIEDDMPNANYYHDTTVGLSFVIPNGWEENPLSQERNILKMKMSPRDGSAAYMTYGWEDF